MPRWQSSASSSAPTAAWSIRRTRRNGIAERSRAGWSGRRAVPSGAVVLPASCDKNPPGSHGEPQDAVMQVVEAHGARIPLIGLGTWDLRGRTCARVVEQALRLGYRHVDTAEMYDNEREVGEGLRASGVKREQVFVTTKIWPSHFAPRELERAAKDSLCGCGSPTSISCCCTG